VERGRISRGGSGQQGQRIERLIETLDLNEDQQAQVRSLFAEQRERIMTLSGQGATLDEIRTEMKRMWKQNSSSISAILHPGQREKFLRMTTSRAANPVTRGRVWVLDKDGTPVPVDIITGISDGNFTEIVRGDLKAGQGVIAGTSQPERRSSGSGLRRFGF